MHTLSPRMLSTLAYDRGEEFDPGQPLGPALLEDLSLIAHAGPVISEPGPYEKSVIAQRARRRRADAPACEVPAWFAADDLVAAPWETRAARLA